MGTGATHVGRRTLIRTGVAGAWATPLVLVSVPAQAAACSAGSPALVLTAFNDSRPAFRQDDGSVSYQPTMVLTNNGPGPVTVLQATATPVASNPAMLVSSLDIEDEDGELLGTVDVPAGLSTLTVNAPAPQDVIAAGSSREYTFLLTLLDAAPGAHEISLSMAGGCSSAGRTVSFTVQELDE